MIRCSKCKGEDVQIVTWINPNTDELYEDFGTFNEPDTSWCDNCEEHGTLEQVPT